MNGNDRSAPEERVDWLRSTPYLAMHALPLAALFTGVHWSAWVVMGGLYYVRRWFVAAGYHRYFSHHSFQVGRLGQFLIALGATTAVQKGPLWWAGHHRYHHQHADQPEDIHSPRRGFWWAHMGWVLCSKYDPTRTELVPDLAKYPELRWLDRNPFVPPVLLGTLVFAFGWLISGTVAGAFGMLFIGFFLSTILLSHTAYSVNSFGHMFGSRRYETRDTSRNNWIIALLTGGDGWHNNHHHYPASARHGFRWFEIDTTYYSLWALNKIGIIRELHRPPPQVVAGQPGHVALPPGVAPGHG